MRTDRQGAPTPAPVATVDRSGYRLSAVTGADTVGGAEHFLGYLLDALPAGVGCTVIGPDEVVLDAVTRSGRSGLVRSAMDVRSMVRALRLAAPDIVLVNLPTFSSCRPAVVAALALRLPVVLVDHLPVPTLGWRGRLVQRLMTATCAARVGVGRRSSRLVEHYVGLAPGTVLTIANGVPVADSGPPTPYRSGRTTPVLGALCRLEWHKGVDVLLHALVHLPGVRLDVAGTGSQRAALEQLAQTLGVDHRVSFLGWLSDQQAFFDGIDALVLPSRHEAMPLAVLEAMHAGLPVIASRVGSLDEVVIPETTGLLVQPEDPVELASACRRLLYDDALRQRLGRAARARAVEHFSDSVMASSYDLLHRTVLRRRGRLPGWAAPRSGRRR